MIMTGITEGGMSEVSFLIGPLRVTSLVISGLGLLYGLLNLSLC